MSVLPLARALCLGDVFTEVPETLLFCKLTFFVICSYVAFIFLPVPLLLTVLKSFRTLFLRSESLLDHQGQLRLLVIGFYGAVIKWTG